MRNAVIRIARDPGFADSLRSYKIFIDFVQVGVIYQKELRSFEVSPGHHDIYLEINWCSSQHLDIDLAAGEEVTLICRSSHPLLAAFRPYFNPERYIELYPEEHI
jgi:hypothetical protein